MDFFRTITMAFYDINVAIEEARRITALNPAAAVAQAEECFKKTLELLKEHNLEVSADKKGAIHHVLFENTQREANFRLYETILRNFQENTAGRSGDWQEYIKDKSLIALMMELSGMFSD